MLTANAVRVAAALFSHRARFWGANTNKVRFMAYSVEESMSDEPFGLDLSALEHLTEDHTKAAMENQGASEGHRLLVGFKVPVTPQWEQEPWDRECAPFPLRAGSVQ